MKKTPSLFLIPFSLILVLIFMLLQPMEALAGAKSALLMWFHSLLPSLLPFMILSSLLVATNSAVLCTGLFHPILHRLFKTSREGTFALVIGFFCGFPMGAKILSDFRIHGKITKEEGDYLLGFCNNFSPMFILSFLCPLLAIPKWKILFIVFGSPLLYGLFYRFLFQKNLAKDDPGTEKKPLTFSFSMVDTAIMSGFSAITKLGGYLILFGIFTKMVTALPAVTILKSLLISLTEITNGIAYTAALPLSFKTKALILLPGLCLGGISGLAQTKSMIGETDYSLKKYILAKTICCLMALVFTLVLC